jgi:carbamoyltransferase
MSKPVYILGISAFYHDSAAALLKDGEIFAAAQEERFTRKKHDHQFPSHAVNYCLAEAGIAFSDLDHVIFYEKPFVKFERLLETYLMTAPRGIRSFLKSMPVWLKEKLFLRDTIAEKLNYHGEIFFADHHESHAASAFYPSPFQRSAIITLDGVGEWSTLTYGLGEGNKITLLKEICFPHSLGLLYSAFTYYIGFKVNSGEYKLMGLASYGEPKYAGVIKNYLIDLKPDGSFRLDQRYFNYCAGLTMTSKWFHDLFGRGPRKPEDPIEQFHMDMARSIQAVTEEIIFKIAAHVYQETGAENLCLAGGVALNCVANGKIVREGPYKKVWIQPVAGDAGGALGAALAVWYNYLGNVRIAAEKKDSQRSSLLGPEFSNDEIKRILDDQAVIYTQLPDDKLFARGAEILAQGKVLGWFQGRMEFGPRALGGRSILGDPRSEEMQTKMNLKIKFRESFRPFAPSVMLEHSGEYFEYAGESPYMLLVTQLRADKRLPVPEQQKNWVGLRRLKIKRSTLPAVTHVDYSARIQTVTQEDNPRYYPLLEAFYEKTGCPAVINTSFNVRGEPIVCTPQDAFECLMRTHMDFLIIGNFVIDRNDQKENKIKVGDLSGFAAD